MAYLDCDVVVIGAGIGGLTVGALLAKRGKRVIILEQAAQAGGRLASFERNGYLFQATSSVFNGFELGGGHERVLGELGLLLAKQHADPGWQLILPNHRLNFYSERIALQNELAREFPAHVKGIRSFFQRMDEIEGVFYDLCQHKNFIAPYTLKEKYIYSREIHSRLVRATGGLENKGAACCRQHVHNEEFKKLLDLPVYFYSLQPLQDCPLLLSAYILGIPKRGVVNFPGGAQRFIQAMLRSLRNLGAEIKYNSLVTKILTEQQLAVGVQLVSGETIRASQVVTTTSRAYLYQKLLEGGNIPGKVRKKLELLKPEWLPFSVYLGVDENVLPYEMRENVFLCNDYQKPMGNTHTLFINVSLPKDIKCAPDGKRALTVTCFLPYAEWERDITYPERKQAKMKEVIDQLAKLINFIEDGLEYSEAASPLTYQAYTQRPQGMLATLAHTPSGFGFNGFSNHTTYKHLWVLGEDTFPGRGSELISIGAINLANLICQD